MFPKTTTSNLCVCVCVRDSAHPWQLAHSISSTDTSNRAARTLRVMTRISCSLPSHDATPLAAAAPDPTTPASGPHHTPLSNGAMMHHNVGGEDIGRIPAKKKGRRVCYYTSLQQFVVGG